jgi:hypothetical protein
MSVPLHKPRLQGTLTRDRRTAACHGGGGSRASRSRRYASSLSPRCRWPRLLPSASLSWSPRSRRAAAAAAGVPAARRPQLPPSSSPVRSYAGVPASGEPGRAKGTDVRVARLPCSLHSYPLPFAFHRFGGAPRGAGIHASRGALSSASVLRTKPKEKENPDPATRAHRASLALDAHPSNQKKAIKNASASEKLV